jgi:nicotinamidase/pyrazinamidase
MEEKRINFEKDRTALLVVDIQPDFMPGGALPVPGADQILSPIGDLMESGIFDLIVAVQDWHPRHHVSFASNHPGRAPMDTIKLYGHEQTLWPDHCVQGTSGAALHPDLPWNRAAAIIRKAMDPATDSYSALRNNWNPKGERPPTGLAGYLKNRAIENIFLCGLARDFCVKWTAEDALGEGFRVWVLWDLCRPIDPSSDRSVCDTLTARGAEIIIVSELYESTEITAPRSP